MLYLEGSPSLELLPSSSKSAVLDSECRLERLTLDSAAVAANRPALCSMRQLRFVQLSAGQALGPGVGSEEAPAALRTLRQQLDAAATAGGRPVPFVVSGPGPSDILRAQRAARAALAAGPPLGALARCVDFMKELWSEVEDLPPLDLRVVQVPLWVTSVCTWALTGALVVKLNASIHW